MAPAAGSYTAWDILPAVIQFWMNNPAQNYGLIMTVKDISAANECVFASSETAVAAQRPKLAVYYEY